MHRSRIAGILIDTPAAQAGAAADFWSAALGAEARHSPGEEQYTVLSGALPGLFTVIQSVDDAPRYHLDIETDDLAAEVARLTALGAEPVARWKDAHTLRAPGGHLLCVIPMHSDPETFASSARTWQLRHAHRAKQRDDPGGAPQQLAVAPALGHSTGSRPS